jgi:hypothetical protein
MVLDGICRAKIFVLISGWLGYFGAAGVSVLTNPEDAGNLVATNLIASRRHNFSFRLKDAPFKFGPRSNKMENKVFPFHVVTRGSPISRKMSAMGDTVFL